MKDQQRPCAQCSFTKTTKPGNLGGSTPDVYIGQAEGPFMVPCHMLCDFTDPNWKEKAFETGQCAGMAIYRANLGLSDKMPSDLLRLPPSPEVFESHEEFLAHHGEMPLVNARYILEEFNPQRMLLMQLIRQDNRIKPVVDKGENS